MLTAQSNPPLTPPPPSIPTPTAAPASGTPPRRPQGPASAPPSSASTSSSSRRRKAAAAADTATAEKRARRRSPIPFAFPPLFRPNASSSASLIASTAEGRPIPLDDATAADRDSALRELNSHYPSRPRYAKSAGAQSTTYSQPVIVRTYPGPPPSRPDSLNRGGGRTSIGGFGGRSGGRTAPSAASTASSVVRRIIPFSTSSGQPGMLSLARAKQKKGLLQGTAGGGSEMGARLPPVEAFTFKSFMANLESDDPTVSSHNINKDLDRIAEICARSRYSLSNQYEVHQLPHGSGESFLAAVTSSRNQPPVGPTLQAVSSDDERNIRRRQRRPGGGRRRSVAVGTLETIMSSSRSSDEDRSKTKKLAADIADEVRGRIAARGESASSCSASSRSGGAGSGGSDDGSEARRRREQQIVEQQDDEEEDLKLARKKSASFATAVLENTTRQSSEALSVADAASPRSSASALVGEPARPQTSTNHLELPRTAGEDGPRRTEGEQGGAEAGHKGEPSSARSTAGSSHHARSQSGGGLLSTLTGWIPWRSDEAADKAGVAKSEAEGSLRELLRTQDNKPNVNDKGKGVDRTG